MALSRGTPRERKTNAKKIGIFFWASGLLVGRLALATPASVPLAAGGGSYAWIEGEKPASANIAVATEPWSAHAEWLSEGKWLKVACEEKDVEKTIPDDGVLIHYDFATAAGGTHEIWNRIGFEFVR